MTTVFLSLAGRDVADWWHQSDDAGKPLVVAWTGSNGETRRRGSRIRLFKTTWPNPRPELRIEAINFEALDTKASPFLVAITAE